MLRAAYRCLPTDPRRHIYNGGPIESRSIERRAIFNDLEQPITQFSRSRYTFYVEYLING